jgi:hypothetical protein
VAQTGLTTDELALIQPSYQCTFDPAKFPYLLYHINGVFYALVNLLYTAGGLSLIAGALNAWALLRKQRRLSPLIFGFLAGVFLIVSTLLHYVTVQAYSVPIYQYLDLVGANASGPTSLSWRPCQAIPLEAAMLRRLAEGVPQLPQTFYPALLGLGALLIGFCLARWWRLREYVQRGPEASRA